MMNKSYKIKKLCLQILIFCSFVQVYFLKIFYINLIFNIVDLILLGKNATKKKQKVDKFTYTICNSKIYKSLPLSITLFFLDGK